MIYPANAGARRLQAQEHGYVTFHLSGQCLGIPVVLVQEVLTAQQISPVPLAPPEVAGFLNLRGQIVTAIDLRTRLGLPRREADASFMNIVIRDRGELFSLLVDEVGDVVAAGTRGLEPTPSSLDPRWREVCDGVIRMDRGLLLVVDVRALLEIEAEVVQAGS